MQVKPPHSAASTHANVPDTGLLESSNITWLRYIELSSRQENVAAEKLQINCWRLSLPVLSNKEAEEKLIRHQLLGDNAAKSLGS